MVEVFRAETTVHLSLKNMGLNAKVWDCFLIVRN